MNEFTVKDESNHKYFSVLPNILSYIGLSAIDRSVYWAIKECAGDHGSCTKSYANLEKMTGIKNSALKKSIKRLSEINNSIQKSLIKINYRKSEFGDPDTNEILITDIWPENFAFFQSNGGGSLKNPPGSLKNPGVGRLKRGGGSLKDYKQEPTNKTTLKKTTTPTPSKGKSSVVVPSDEDKAIANKIRTFVDSKGDVYGEDWKIPIEKLENLSSIYGSLYLDDQFKYTYKRQKDYLANLKKMHPDPKCKPVNRPYVYLKKACEENWAESNNLKENL